MIFFISWHLPSYPADNILELIKERGYFIWGSDAEGGAPYVFPDPKELSRLIGKDSSIVSIIAMVELTKTYNILATTTLRFLELGLIVAFLYFVMSYPLLLLAQRLEDILRGKKR